ncbi:MAG: helix-turn-helix transcriptional regulator [Bacteroidales bacterium]|nr:helix-turn-helix transcriptional regulator [Bacteroidales bacterium]
MGIFFTTALVLILLYLTVRQIVKCFRDGSLKRNDKARIVVILLMELTGFVITAVSDKCSLHEGAVVILTGTLGLSSLSLSFIKSVVADAIMKLTIIVQCSYSAYQLAVLFVGMPLPSQTASLIVLLAAHMSISVIYAVSVALKISDIKFMLKSGAPWNTVCMVTDIVYIVFFNVYTVGYYLLMSVCPSCCTILSAVYSILLLSIQYAFVRRSNNSSLFVFWEGHESRIVESMRLSHADLAGEGPGVDVLYKNIYDRVLDYFQDNRPYLNHDLTINDVVKVLFTNKLYISKAICMYTGRNFCQFVNYYRITYAIDIFRKDPTLKVVDISSRSGFNSSVSFSMAFRLFIGEKPSDWFRRERARLTKRSK